MNIIGLGDSLGYIRAGGWTRREICRVYILYIHHLHDLPEEFVNLLHRTKNGFSGHRAQIHVN